PQPAPSEKAPLAERVEGANGRHHEPEVLVVDELHELRFRRVRRAERALGDALPVRVLEDAAGDAAARLHPAADRQAPVRALDAAQGELQERAAPLAGGERRELPAGGCLLLSHRLKATRSGR